MTSGPQGPARRTRPAAWCFTTRPREQLGDSETAKPRVRVEVEIQGRKHRGVWGGRKGRVDSVRVSEWRIER